jgi:hypothetical protein
MRPAFDGKARVASAPSRDGSGQAPGSVRKSWSRLRKVRPEGVNSGEGASRLGQGMRRALQAVLQLGFPKRRKSRPVVPEVPDQAQIILADLDALDPTQRDAVARNLGLLWDAFVMEYGGVSGFLAEPVTHQNAYLAKLDAAARRMESSKASKSGHHYVSVALMKEYVSSFRSRSVAESAVQLSHRVASLIDRSRELGA